MGLKDLFHGETAAERPIPLVEYITLVLVLFPIGVEIHFA
jgi:hypothetical protein